MYRRPASTTFSSMRVFVVCAALLSGAAQEAYGQRVYANSQQHGRGGICVSAVDNPTRAINDDYADYSTLRVSVGLGCTAWQNLQFTNANKPIASTPIIVRYGASGNILSLLENSSIYLTQNGTQTGGAYDAGGSIIDALGLFGTHGGEVLIPAQGVEKNGVRLNIGGLASLGASIDYYYAFFIVAPEADDVTICSGQQAVFVIKNAQTGYTYKLYETIASTIELATSASGTITTPPLSASASPKTYYLEALENGIYPSGRTPVTVTVSPKPNTPNAQIQTNSSY